MEKRYRPDLGDQIIEIRGTLHLVSGKGQRERLVCQQNVACDVFERQPAQIQERMNEKIRESLLHQKDKYLKENPNF